MYENLCEMFPDSIIDDQAAFMGLCQEINDLAKPKIQKIKIMLFLH